MSETKELRGSPLDINDLVEKSTALANGINPSKPVPSISSQTYLTRTPK